MAPKEFWTKDKDAKLKQLYLTEMDIELIAKQLDCSANAAYKRAHKLGYKRPSFVWTPERNTKLKKLYQTDQTVEQIAKELGCSPDAVRNQAERIGARRLAKTSKYHGVSWIADRKTWRATAYSERTGQVVIGSYKKEIEAAKAYDAFIKRMKWNRPLNFPG